jgi:hypothetical protein
MGDQFIEKVCSIADCSRVDAEAAIKSLNTTDLVEVVAFLLKPPECMGSRHIPAKPTNNDGLTDEVRENLSKARVVSDIMANPPTSSSRSGPQRMTFGGLLPSSEGAAVRLEGLPMISEEPSQKQ